MMGEQAGNKASEELAASRQSLAAPQFEGLKLFRITSDSPTTTTTSTTTSTSTTSTTSTTTTTTTPAPCFARIWRGIPVDVQFDDSSASFGYRPVVTIERIQDSVALMSPTSLTISVNDIVLAGLINNRWWILARYFNCPQASVTTTTTTTTTSTSTTTPAPLPR